MFEMLTDYLNNNISGRTYDVRNYEEKCGFIKVWHTYCYKDDCQSETETIDISFGDLMVWVYQNKK